MFSFFLFSLSGMHRLELFFYDSTMTSVTSSSNFQSHDNFH